MLHIPNTSRFPGEYFHAASLIALALFGWFTQSRIFWYYVTAYVTVRFSKFLFIISKSVFVHGIMPPMDVTQFKDKWTVVTGGTDGIGKAYTLELARARGLKKFYLIGRSADKLAVVAGALKKSHGAEVKTHVFDFDNGDWPTLEKEIKELDVGILLNFAGLAPNTIGNLIEQEEGMASKIMRVNLMSCIRMNELVLPGMVKKDQGIIVNMSSMTGWRPLPYTSSYPASKAAISFFSDTLSDEFRGTGVKVQCLVPMLVATSLASYDKSEANDIFVVSTETFARQAVRAIGTFELICGCWQHDFQIALAQLISPWFFKQLFVPFGMLGLHRQRVADFHKKNKD
ncbi:unnamed protein product, partial [Mesorhabditis spiculigera]